MHPTPPDSGYHVFVSHSGTDAWVAKQIAREIAACGARPFLAEIDIPIGAVFELELYRTLGRASELVLLATPWALNRRYVWLEIGSAWRSGIPVIVLLYGVTPAELRYEADTPIFVLERNLLNLNDIERYLTQLAERVRGPAHEGTE